MRVTLASLFILPFLLLSPATRAAPPQTLNYQGYLTSSSGTAVNTGVSITFRIYASASGGAALWAETQNVTVTNGNFSVALGNTTPFGLDFGSPYFLGVQVGSDPEMTPRQPLAASPYAHRAVTADQLGTAALIPGEQITGSLSAATIPVANVIGAGVGGVSSVATGAGLTGGPITASGTIGLAATQLLPTTACASNQVPKWNGSTWNCAAGDGLPAGGVAGQVLVGSASGPVWSTAPTLGNLMLPDSTSTTGNLLKNGAPFLHNFGAQNSFFGAAAGNFVMTGASNTGLGLLALASNTTGSLNTAAGAGTLSSNTVGDRNTAVGQGALTLNTVGNFNTAVGQAALLANVDGGLNTAVGYSALAANSSGVSNTATGGGALGANTTGSNNAALGRHALMTNTGGSENVALGVAALMANAGGNENTAAGMAAMAGNSSGIRNTALGRSALGSNATGNDNIGIGYNGGGSLTTGSNNIAIGHPGNVAESATTRLGNAQTRTFIAGIRGVTPGAADGLPVIIDSNGQLGTAASAGGTGTVTSITAGAGLAGGTITGSGTISIDPASAILAGNFLKQGGNAFGATAILGTSDSNAVEVHANGSRVLRIEPDGVSPNTIGGSSSNAVTSGVIGATIWGGGASGQNRVTDVYGTVGGGAGNVAGNDNGAQNDAFGATVGGGSGNTASGSLATVAGGTLNTAGAEGSTVAGGATNVVSASYGTIGGGTANVASGSYAAVSGGRDNGAWGSYSFVAGGNNNTANGNRSLAAGTMAKTSSPIGVAHDGAFVWADSNTINFHSAASNEFAARSTGGFRFVTAIDGSGNPTRTTAINPNGELDFGSNTRQMINLWGPSSYGIGVQAATLYQRSGAHFAWYVGGTHSDTVFEPGGAGYALMTLTDGSPAGLPAVSGIARAQTFTSTSDRAAKDAFEMVDAAKVLAALVNMPLQSWKYRNEDKVRHIGPTAQDFRAAFNVGYDDKTIATVDADGVAMAAIQGLHQLVKEKDAMISGQAARITGLEQELQRIKTVLGLK